MNVAALLLPEGNSAGKVFVFVKSNSSTVGSCGGAFGIFRFGSSTTLFLLSVRGFEPAVTAVFPLMSVRVTVIPFSKV